MELVPSSMKIADFYITATDDSHYYFKKPNIFKAFSA